MGCLTEMTFKIWEGHFSLKKWAKPKKINSEKINKMINFTMPKMKFEKKQKSFVGFYHTKALIIFYLLSVVQMLTEHIPLSAVSQPNLFYSFFYFLLTE